METNRQIGLGRIKDYSADEYNPYFLHYRTLFADLEKAAVHARGRLLDIGCGNKPYEKMFDGRITEYVGCDIVQSSENRVDVICQATNIPLEGDSFDTILCTQVIEHVADHRQLLRETFRLLKSGGILILSGPMYWPLHEEPHDFFRFTEHGFRYLLEGIGFTVDQIQCNGGDWAVFGQALIHTIQPSKLYKPGIVRLINCFFARLDDRRRRYTNPMNYVIIARKP